MARCVLVSCLVGAPFVAALAVAGHPAASARSIAIRPRLAVQRSGPVFAQDASLVALPPAGYAGAVAAGTKKAGLSVPKILTLSVLSGCHIGFGAFLMLSVGGRCPGLLASDPGLRQMVLGAFGLPVGLFMTLMTGAELFTGNTMVVTAAVAEGEADAGGLAKSWLVSYVGNFIGSVLFAALVFHGATPAAGPAMGVAAMKVGLSFKTALIRGILCNWLVTMAVFMANQARDATGKMVAVWFPISAFIALGLEHSVANMFIIPLGIFSGAAVTWKAFLMQNLLPVTLGNIIGGALCTTMPLALAYGKRSK